MRSNASAAAFGAESEFRLNDARHCKYLARGLTICCPDALYGSLHALQEPSVFSVLPLLVEISTFAPETFVLCHEIFPQDAIVLASKIFETKVPD
jgi:hypothetical protein